MKNRSIPFVSVVMAALTISACSTQTEEPAQNAEAGATGSAATAAPDAEQSSVFSPLTSVADYWADHPERANDRARTGMLLLNEQGTDSKSFALPDAAAQESVMVILICDSKSTYEITIGNDTNSELSSTSGSSCGGPAINSYTTPPHDPADPGTVPDRIQVNVPSGVDYYLTAYGVGNA